MSEGKAEMQHDGTGIGTRCVLSSELMTDMVAVRKRGRRGELEMSETEGALSRWCSQWQWQLTPSRRRHCRHQDSPRDGTRLPKTRQGNEPGSYSSLHSFLPQCLDGWP